MATKTAFRSTGIGIRIIAKYDKGPYINLFWDNGNETPFEVINVYDYAKGEIEEFNLSKKLTEWIRSTGATEIRNYYRHTA